VSDLDTAPGGWVRTTLGDLGVYINGRAFKSSEWSLTGRPIVRIQDLTGSNRNPHYFDGDVEERYVVRPGDLLVSWSATLGAYIWDGPEAVLNQHIFKVKSKIDQRLHYHLIRESLAELYETAHGSGMVHVTKDLFDGLPVTLPADRAAQSELAALLDSVEESHESSLGYLNVARLAIERLRTATLNAACSGRLTEAWRHEHENPGSVDHVLALARERREEEQGRRYREPELNKHAEDVTPPETWVLSPTGLLLESLKYGTSKRSEYGCGGVAVLRIPNVSAGRTDLTDLKFAELTEHEIRNLALRVSDLLLIRSNGSPQLVGRTVMVSAEAEGMAYAGYLMRLRVDCSICEPSYLALSLASPYVRRQIEMPLRSTSGVHNINTDEVRGLAIPLPPIDEQLVIVERASATLTAADRLLHLIRDASRASDRTFQAVLRKAFRGELARAS